MGLGLWRRQQPIFKSRSRWSRRLAVGAAIVVVVALVAVAGSSDDDRPAVSGDGDVAHVHGLGVNPADGAVFVATHTGLYTLDEDGRLETDGDDLYVALSEAGRTVIRRSTNQGESWDVLHRSGP